MIKYTDIKDIEWYKKEEEHINQSKLKLLLKGLEEYKRKKDSDLYYEEKSYFVIGSAVDCLITQGKEDFKKLFHISDISKPSETVMSIVNLIFDIITNNNIEGINNLEKAGDTIILSACVDHDYYNNRKDESRIKLIKDTGSIYFNELIKSKNKQIIDIEQYSVALSLVEKIRQGKYTFKLFSSEYENSKNTEIFYQFPIYFEIKDIQCKALLDMIVIDHENKTITPIDIKTTSENCY